MRKKIAVLVALMPLLSGIRITEANDENPSETIVSALEVSAAAWNEGNLEAFIAPYHESATFMSSSGPIGREEMREYFRDKYFSEGRPEQNLRFESIQIRQQGPGNTLVTGRYVLSGGDQPERTGWFTLVWKRTAAGWRILHDHSS